ncbi:hypothetical protein [Variovorax sp. GB1P17]|uniref:hypothetical protein n=1 Tax=Variovorax sp. GB1P17 TaxID=3443740 RepID=UPI003F4825B1
MMGAPDANKGRPSLLGSNEATTAASPAAPSGESTRVLAQLGGHNADKRSFIKRPSVWATLVLLIGVGGATTYHLQQSRRADASVNVAAATPVDPAPAVVAAPSKPEAPAAAATAPSPATPEPTPARIVESDASSQQQQSTPFAAIGAQPMVAPPAGKSAHVAAKPPAKSTARTDKTATAAAKKPEHVASKQPTRAANNNKPVKTAANASKTPRRAGDSTQAASRPGKPDPDTDLLTALLKRSKTSDPAPQPSALTEVAADCKSGQRCKP